jgi:hypothetical protein
MGCGSAGVRSKAIPPPPDPNRAPEHLGDRFFYSPGEFLQWTVSWRGIKGVESRFAIGKAGDVDGKHVIIAYTETYTTGVAEVFKEVREEIRSVIDVDQGVPVSNESEERDGSERERVEASFEAGAHSVDVFPDSGKRRSWTLNNDEPVQDQHTALALLRSWSGQPGTRGTFLLQSGRGLYRVEVAVVGAEKLKTRWGTLPAIRIAGSARRLSKNGAKNAPPVTREFVFWHSNDARRLPLRFQVQTRFGELNAELTEFAEPADPRELIDVDRKS